MRVKVYCVIILIRFNSNRRHRAGGVFTLQIYSSEKFVVDGKGPFTNETSSRRGEGGQ